MEEKKLTDEEIIKALEHCATEITCSGCVKYNGEPTIDYFKCMRDTKKNVVYLFRRLQRENAEKDKKIEYYKDREKSFVNAVKKLTKEKSELKAEIERLTEENEYLDGCAKQFLADYQNAQVQVDELKTWLDMKEHCIAISKDKEQQAVKDTVKEMIEEIDNVKEIFSNDIVGYNQAQGWLMCIDEFKEIARRKGVEVE